MERRRSHSDALVEGFQKPRRLSFGALASPGPEHLEQEKRVRREIANSNERRRMQSINAGFETLRLLLPPTQDGEKMSKATILQLTAEYINSLLGRLNSLESEVAVYRQAAGVQMPAVLPDFSIDLGIARKRKSDDQKKRSTSVRSRRRRFDNDLLIERSDMPGGSPPLADVRQASPSNSFNSSISISPPSPLPDFAHTTSARLEHLVMAIEQIEGGKTLHTGENEEHDDSILTECRSSSSVDACWQSPQICTLSDVQNSSLKPITSFSDPVILSTSTDISTPPVSVSESDVSSLNSTGYPLVTKLLNHPIPHKYLHRPQVVANSSH